MTLSKVVAAGAVALAVTCGAALAQVPAGRMYSFHSTAQGGCPALDWHVMVEAGGALSGMIAWNNMESMAKATGTASNGKVQMTAKEVGGSGRTATVTGTIQPNGYFVVNIKGPSVDCQGITVPYYVPAAGGGSG